MLHACGETPGREFWRFSRPCGEQLSIALLLAISDAVGKYGSQFVLDDGKSREQVEPREGEAGASEVLSAPPPVRGRDGDVVDPGVTASGAIRGSEEVQEAGCLTLTGRLGRRRRRLDPKADVVDRVIPYAVVELVAPVTGRGSHAHR